MGFNLGFKGLNKLPLNCWASFETNPIVLKRTEVNCEIPYDTTQMQYSEASGKKFRDGVPFPL